MPNCAFLLATCMTQLYLGCSGGPWVLNKALYPIQSGSKFNPDLLIQIQIQSRYKLNPDLNPIWIQIQCGSKSNPNLNPMQIQIQYQPML